MTLPAGRLREPLDAARAADAIVVADEGDESAGSRIAAALHAPRVFRLRKVFERPRLVDPPNRPVAPAAGTRVLAVAGIARPERFFRSVEAEGWTVAGEVTFPGPPPFTPADMARIGRTTAARARAVMVLTTEKDLVRMLPLRPFALPVAWVPLRVVIEPAHEFRAWLPESAGAAVVSADNGTAVAAPPPRVRRSSRASPGSIARGCPGSSSTSRGGRSASLFYAFDAAAPARGGARTWRARFPRAPSADCRRSRAACSSTSARCCSSC